MVTVRKFDSSLKKDWDTFLGHSRVPLFLFKRDFLEYHADRFVDSSLIFYEGDEILALFPASSHEGVLVSHGGVTYGGVLLGSKVRANAVLEIFELLIDYARISGFRKIIYKAIPYIYANRGAQEDLYAMTRLGASLVRRDLSSVIHLDNRLKLSKGRKWLISRAKKVGLMPTSSENWSEFHSLLSLALKRHGVIPVHSPEELCLLHSRFPENIELKTIDHNGKMIAGALLFRFGKVTHTQYLATNDEGKELGALDALIEICIQESKERNERYFSFGISTEKGGQVLNSGLINQKESFGARGLVLDFYEININ